MTEVLAGSVPAQVAVLGQEGNWYAGGCRVRGEQVMSPVGSRQLFLFNPAIGCQNKSDWSESHLKPAFSLPLMIPVPSHVYVNIILDSTVANSAFVYGLAQKLWSKDMFLLWSGVQGGAKAEKLSEAWTKAPTCAIGLIAWN